VRAAGVRRGDLVLDLGAGPGALTRGLADAGAEAIAVEADAALAAGLRRRLAGRAVRVVQADATSWPWPERPFAVVANLPFARSAEILRALLRDPRTPLRRADVIVQWELACKRAEVWPGRVQSVCCGPWYELSATRRLDPSAFAPRPSVAAGVLRILPRPEPLLDPADAPRYAALVRHAFASPRPLRSALAGRLSPLQLKRLAAAHGFSPDAHARDLDVAQWSALYRFVRAAR
jgi:23S rRNA (adenine-N6)-dimethyltransferase